MINSFKEKQNAYNKSTNINSSKFITNGNGATSICVGINTINAAIISNYSEGPDSITAFTFKSDGDLNKGDYFSWLDRTYFIYEIPSITKQTSYNKYFAYECNISFNIGGNILNAYFVNSLDKYEDTSLVKQIAIMSKESPLIICPKNNLIKIGTIITFLSSSFKINTIDKISNQGIYYISLSSVSNSKQTDLDIVDIIGTNDVKSGSILELATTNYYFRSNVKVEIIERNQNKIKIRIPYGITELEITTKNLTGEKVITTYTVL